MTKKEKKIKGGKHKYILKTRLQLKIHFEKAAVYLALHFFLEEFDDYLNFQPQTTPACHTVYIENEAMAF